MLANVVGPSAYAPRLLFLQVPERKSIKNRVHLDLKASERMELEVERLIGLGARKVERLDFGGLDFFTVMQDPEGNEFCVEPGPGDERASS